MDRKIDNQNVQDILSLTPMQEGMLFHYLQKSSGQELYFEQLVLHLAGELDVELVQQAWNQVVATNELLRTVFRWEKLQKPVQIVLKEAVAPLRIVDLSTQEQGDQVGRDQISEIDPGQFWEEQSQVDHTETVLIRGVGPERKRQVQKILDQDRNEGLDLRQEPFRITLIKFTADQWTMVVSNHHILYDGWSNGIILQEFFQVLQALAEGKVLSPQKKSPFGEFVKWLQDQDVEGQKEYWGNYLAGFDTRTMLYGTVDDQSWGPYQNSNEEKGTDGEGQQSSSQWYEFSVDQRLTQQMHGFVAEQRITLATLLYAVWGILLQKYNNTDDVVFGTTGSGRNVPIKGMEEMVGLFINTIPCRVQSTDSSQKILHLLQTLEQSLRERTDYEHLPLVEINSLAELRTHESLFDSIVVIENYPLEKKLAKMGHPLQVTSYSTVEATNFDLTLAVEVDDALQLKLGYRPDRFCLADLERMAGHFVNILEFVLDHPDAHLADVTMLSEAEGEGMIFEESLEYPKDQTISNLFEARVQESPDAVAVQYQGEVLTYAELNRKANQLAGYLQSQGVRRDQPVGIMVERSLEMVIGIMAILKAGGAYVPINPTYPAERIQYMLADCGAEILLTQTCFLGQVEFDGEVISLEDDSVYRGSEANLNLMMDSRAVAYVIYTSGSTGQPKGVMVSHQALSNFLYNLYHTFDQQVGVGDRCLSLTNISFDVSVGEIFLPLLFGGTLVLFTNDLIPDLDQLAQTIVEDQITFAYIPPTILPDVNQRLREQIDQVCLNKMLVGVEPILDYVLEEYLELHPKMQVVNGYGPTEATICATFYKYGQQKPSGRIVPIGQALANTQVYLLDKDLHPVPVGVPGELCIAGDGLAQGYLNQPLLTAEKFVSDPFVAGRRMYRTGDLAKWLPDGNILFQGRIDQQVKIRGYRIELGEIETALLDHPGVDEAIVLAREGQDGTKYLCAYLVGGAEEELEVGEIRERLALRLPDFMIPSYFVTLEELPLTANGKVDRRVLPEPDGNLLARREYLAPRNELEEKIALLWEEVLGVESPGVNDHFFEMGGHSLKATRLIGRIHKVLEVEVPVEQIFTTPTIAGLARFIQEAQQATYAEIPKVAEQEVYQVSSAQKRMFLLQEMDFESTGYNMPAAFEIVGRLELHKVLRAWDALIRKHETLRTSFAKQDGQIVQRVHQNVDFAVGYRDDLQNLDFENLDEIMRPLVASFVQPFDLTRGPLVRVEIVRLAEERFVLIFDMHHIISDGISMGILIQEFVEMYQQKSIDQSLKIQYKDYAAWQQQWLESEELKKEEEYWLAQFADEIPLLNLPTDYSRPGVRSLVGDVVQLALKPKLVGQAQELARRTGSTLYMVLLTAVNILLAKYTGQEDIIVGSPIAGRPHPDLEKLIGIFVNTLAMRNQPQGEKRCIDLLKEVRETALAAYQHQEYQFEDLIEKLNLRRDLSRNPLFDFLFVMQNMEQREIQLPGLTLHPLDVVPRAAKFDLAITATEQASEDGVTIELEFEYCRELFKATTIQRMGRHFVQVLELLVENPEITINELQILKDSEREQILVGFNDTEAIYPKEKTVTQLIEEQVERHPLQMAVGFAGEEMSYQKLNHRANLLANHLRAKGVTRQSVVGLLVERSIEMMVGILAVWKACGAYLPISTSYPEDRVQYMLEDSGAEILLTQPHLLDRVEFTGEILDLHNEDLYQQTDQTAFGLRETDQYGESCATDLAYVIYTSGSTGKPKGVMISHQALNNFIHGYYQRFRGEIGPKDRCLSLANISFDACVSELFLALPFGATLILYENEQIPDLQRLTGTILEQGITMAFIPPTLLKELYHRLSEESGRIKLNKLMVGVEPILDTVLEEFMRLSPELQILNGYGPTEATICSSTFKYVAGNPHGVKVPIGTPLANTQIYILDQYDNPVPIGVPGELCIAGNGLAKGYLNRPELTAEKFVLNPFILGQRMYRTGDLAKWLADGNIEFVGRMDHQVKVRGYRIELGEIEYQLLQYPPVTEVLVQALEDADGVKELCAYLVASREVTVEELREFLLASLPDYMVPAYFVVLDRFPINANGKIDRKALPTPSGRGALGTQYEPPQNEIQEKLQAIWQDILGVEQIGIHDNFFALGGHSLKATAVTGQIQKELAVEVSLREIFKRPTIKELGKFIQGATENIYVALEKVEHKEYYLASPAQKRMYMLQQFDLDGVRYNMPGLLLIEGDLDLDQVTRAFQGLLARHEILRTSFATLNGQVVQQVHSDVEFAVEILSAKDTQEETPETGEQGRIRKIVQEYVRPFNLGVAPLIRVGVLPLAEEKHLLIVDLHHIVADGASMAILVDEFALLYEGAELPEVKLQYKDVAEWQVRQLHSDQMQRQEEYWLSQFADEVPVLELPTDYPRPAVQSMEGQTIGLTLEPEVSAGLKDLAWRTGSTLYMVLLAGVNILLAQYSGQEDLVIGTPIAGRQQHADLEQVMGLMVNTLALRNQPEGGKTYLNFLQEVKENSLLAYENQDYQFEQLVEKLQLPKDLSRNPLFDVLFSLQNMDQGELRFGGLQLTPYPYENQTAKFDLSIIATETAQGIHFDLEYSTCLFAPETIVRMCTHLQQIFRVVIEKPDCLLSQIDLLTTEEKEEILGQFNDTSREYPRNLTIHQLFTRQVEKYPEETAIVFAGERLTYAELDAKSNRLARLLLKKGVQEDTLVGIMTQRSVEMVIGVLAILKAGGAYMPMDLEYPAERIRFMVADGSVQILLTLGEIRDDLDLECEILDLGQMDDLLEGISAGCVPVVNSATSLAYVMYTSGSTGQPKGVMVTQRNVVRLVKENILFTPEAGDKMMQTGTLAFDASTFEIWGALLNGLELHLGSKDLILRPEEMGEYLALEQIRILFLTTSLFNLMADQNPAIFQPLKYIYTGGEAISPSHVQKIKAKCPDLQVVNAYGPTENGVISTCYFIGQEVKEDIPIGTLISNTTGYILNKYQRLAPIGVYGELWLGGDGIARGYLNNPELTEEKFVQHPMLPEERLYRSGDLVRWLPDGNIQYRGRVDHQVKIRGFRIEPGEIEKHLLALPAIQEAVVLARQDEAGNKYLCGYLVGTKSISIGELREELRSSLPDYMIPAYFIQLQSLPLKQNGKVDLKALPEPDGQISTGVEYVAPKTDLEKVLALLWKEILDLEQVGVHDNFFDLGGHSLKATLLTSKIHQHCHVNLPLGEIFKRPTIRKLAEYLGGLEKEQFASIQPAPVMEYYPASRAQKRIYLTCQFDGIGVSYNMPGAVQIKGDLDQERLEQVFNQIVTRHETLRTSFTMVEGQVVQKIQPDLHLNVEQIEMGGLKPLEHLAEFVRPFDLEEAPLLRVGLVQSETKEQMLLFDMHHIISDGISIDNLVREFGALYHGQNLPELSIQYKDFAVWQEELVASGEMASQEQYWLDTFQGQIPTLNLPTDYPRPSVQSYRGGLVKFELDEDLMGKLKELASRNGATLYMVLLAVFNLVIYKYTGEEDLVIGSPVAGRRHADLEQLIGMFVNMLPLRNQPCGERSFLEFLAEVRENTLQAMAHQDYQFEELLEQLGIRRDLSRHPLFDLVFSLQDGTERGEVVLDELTLTPEPFESHISKFDLTLEAVVEDERIWFGLEYCADLFTEMTMKRFAGHYLHLIQEICHDPSKQLAQISMLSQAERTQILYDFNATQMDYPDQGTLHELFAQQAERTPTRVALVSGEDQITYGELHKRVHDLALRLRGLGVEPDQIVGIMAERSLEMLVGILGVLTAGGAYMPIDPDYPVERIQFMLEDSATNILLTQDDCVARIGQDGLIPYSGKVVPLGNLTDAGGSDANVKESILNVNTPDNLAYVMYTSGSTGKPKGVMIQHRGVVSLSQYYNQLFDLENEKRVLHLSNVSFDTSVVEIFPPLLYGATVYVIDKEVALNKERLIRYVEKEQINFVQFVPMMLREIFGEMEKPASLDTVIVGGDKLEDQLKDQMLALGYPLTNHYGPTEATVDAIVARCEVGKSTIGKPIANAKVYILDQDQNLTPIGVPGELCIAGVGLARGYLNRPDLTEEKFILNPLDAGNGEERIYRTGDLACWQPDGNITFLGRIDNQVKIRGYRIELGEIEERLLEYPGVTGAVVIDRVDTTGYKYLCAYLVADQPMALDEIKCELAEKLPDYMIPAHFMQLEKIPLTHNGKVDRGGLPEPEGGVVSTGVYVAPVNEVEVRLIEIWEEVLGLVGASGLEDEQTSLIGTRDNFFELGGHSLKVMTLISQIQREWGVEVPFGEVFNRPTVQELAQYILHADKGNLVQISPIQPVDDREYYPVSSSQRRIFIQWQLHPESKSYNMPTTIMLEGKLDQTRLQRAIELLVQRHEALRTSFEVVAGEPVQRIHPEVPVAINHLEMDESLLKGQVEQLVQPFDLQVAPLMRVTLIHCAEEKYLLFFDVHHIISDGVSMSILIRDFASLFAGQELSPLRIQYKDLATWQHSHLQSDQMAKLSRYWLDRLENFVYTELPATSMVESDQPEGKTCQVKLTSELTQSINAFCLQQKMSKFAFLLGMFKLILMKVIHQDDLTIGIPVAGRKEQELQEIMGVFLNLLVIRTQLDKKISCNEYLLGLRDDLLADQEHQDYPYEFLFEKMKDTRNFEQNSLFSILFNYMPYQEEEELQLDGVMIKPYSFEEVEPKYSLTLYVIEGRDDLQINAVYDNRLDGHLVEMILQSFSPLIKQVLADPELSLKDFTLADQADVEPELEDFDMDFDNDDFF